MPRAAQQHFQHLKFPARQPEAARGRGQLTGRPIERDVAQPQAGIGLRGVGARHRAHARQQLAHGKRLGQIVVCAAVQPLHLVVDLGLGGQQQHGKQVAPRAQLTEHLDPVHHRHHNVQHRAVIASAVQTVERGLPVVYRIHRVARALQYGPQRFGQRLFILCKQ